MKRTALLKLILLAVLACVLLAACGKDGEKKKGKSRDTDNKPTATETATPTVEPSAEPTSAPTDTPTPTVDPASRKTDKYNGTWYGYTFDAIEVGVIECKDDPSMDYRIRIDGDKMIYSTSRNRNIGSDMASTSEFVLRTSFTDAERAMYEKMGYGMETYLDTPTDVSKGHLVYSCTAETDYGALFIIDAQADGSLKTLYAYVADNGSFPVFTDGVYKKEPLFPMGTYYEDYLGIWYGKTYSTYLEEGYEIDEENPLDLRLWFEEDGTLTIVETWDEDGGEDSAAYHFRFRDNDFTETEMKLYEKWDADGIRVWGQKQSGEVCAAIDQGADISLNRLLFTCTDEEYPNDLLEVHWIEEYQRVAVKWFSYEPADSREYIVYITFDRKFPSMFREGESYTDFIGVWEGCDGTDPDSRWTIYPDGTAVEKTAEGEHKYVLRTKMSDSDPEWLKQDPALNKVVTDLSKRYAVFVDPTGKLFDSMVLIGYDLLLEEPLRIHVIRGEYILNFLDLSHLEINEIFTRQKGLER